MILYVNGDSHSAGAEAVNPHAFAEDDRLYWALGRKPHPDNLRASYGCELANLMGAILECDAESASSNDRIFRTTQKYLQTETPDYLVIGWTTWEREEWTHNDRVYQVTASGTDTVPKELQTQYKEWVIEQSDPAVRHKKIKDMHDRIWKLHNDLDQRCIPHLFFNTYSDFNTIQQLGVETYNWGQSYLRPYNIDSTYYNWCLANGFKTVNPNSYHFGADAHCAWGNYLYQNFVQNTLTS